MTDTPVDLDATEGDGDAQRPRSRSADPLAAMNARPAVREGGPDMVQLLTPEGQRLANETYDAVIEGLSDTISTLTNNRINDIIKVLTIISVILLPLTLISGIFGMNVTLPGTFERQPYAFEVILGSMVVVMVASAP